MRIEKPGVGKFINGGAADPFGGEAQNETNHAPQPAKRGMGRPPTGRAMIKDPIKTSLNMEREEHQFFSIAAIQQNKGFNDLIVGILREWRAGHTK